MDNDVKNKPVVRINVGNNKYVKAVKITYNGIVNGLTYLEQKLFKNNDLVVFLKEETIKQLQNYDPQNFNFYDTQIAENEEFVDREFEAHKTKIELEKRN